MTQSVEIGDLVRVMDLLDDDAWDARIVIGFDGNQPFVLSPSGEIELLDTFCRWVILSSFKEAVG